MFGFDWTGLSVPHFGFTLDWIEGGVLHLNVAMFRPAGSVFLVPMGMHASGHLGWQHEHVDADAEVHGGRAGDGGTEPGGVGTREDERGVVQSSNRG